MIHQTLREANVARQQEWDGNGHANNDDWRVNELMGETGEVCNILKKLHRARAGVPGSRADKEMLADELADVVICLDLVLMTRGLRETIPASEMSFLDGNQFLTGLGRFLFSAVSRFDQTLIDNSAYIIGHADVVHSTCLFIARSEDIDLQAAVAKKFNETTRKMCLKTFLIPAA